MGVFLAPNSPWKGAATCDFTMKCGCLHRSCDVYLGKSGTKIAQVRYGEIEQESSIFSLAYDLWFLSFFLGVELIMWCGVQVRRQFFAGILLGREKFSVTVFPNVDYVFVAALFVMLHEIVYYAEIKKHIDNDKNRSTGIQLTEAAMS